MTGLFQPEKSRYTIREFSASFLLLRAVVPFMRELCSRKKNESFQSWTFGASLNIFGKAEIYEVNFAYEHQLSFLFSFSGFKNTQEISVPKKIPSFLFSFHL